MNKLPCLFIREQLDKYTPAKSKTNRVEEGLWKPIPHRRFFSPGGNNITIAAFARFLYNCQSRRN